MNTISVSCPIHGAPTGTTILTNAVTPLTDMLTYDNDVAVIFAASNSGGNGEESEDDLEPMSMQTHRVPFQLPHSLMTDHLQ